MLEIFKVPKKEQIRISEKSLRRSVMAFFEKMGEISEDAAIATDTLVSSDLRGVESHGVSNMLRYYLDGYMKEKIKARPNWHIVNETPGTATLDADNGLVVFLGKHAMQIAIDKAKKRLGDKASLVNWIVSDINVFIPTIVLIKEYKIIYILTAFTAIFTAYTGILYVFANRFIIQKFINGNQ